MVNEIYPWAVVLTSFDPKYFDYLGPDCHKPPRTIDEAARHLATWFYDNTKAGKLHKMISRLPEELWTLALKKWRDRDHDT